MKRIIPLLAVVFFQLYIIDVSAQDWPNLLRYQSQNEELKSQPIPKDRVVFMGNSITDFWIRFSAEFYIL